MNQQEKTNTNVAFPPEMYSEFYALCRAAGIFSLTEKAAEHKAKQIFTALAKKYSISHQ
jgi:hypothetical protein